MASPAATSSSGTITRWRGDALAVIDQLTEGPLVLVGSSMGGWLACLAALARPDRVRGLVLIAPAADFTSALLEPGLPPEARAALERDGIWMRPSRLRPGGYPITARPARGRRALDDPARPGPDPASRCASCRAARTDVPWRHALAFGHALKSEDVVFTLIRDGDHRLSRPEDLARLIAVVEELTTD